MEVTISFPTKQVVAEFFDQMAAKIRLYAALGLYQSGELSIGAACELAGASHYHFLDLMQREGAYVRTQTPDELEAEFQQLWR